MYDKNFKCLIVGPAGCGKTELIFNIIKEIQDNYYEIIFCTSICSEDYTIPFPNVKLLKISSTEDIPTIESFDRPTGESFDRATIESFNNNFKRLIIFDELFFYNKGIIEKYFLFSRSSRIDSIVTSQSYLDTPGGLRINCSILHLFNTPGRREINKILYDISYIPELTRDTLHELTGCYEYITIDKNRRLIYKKNKISIYNING
jgi:GTPase SAR1 family protein